MATGAPKISVIIPVYNGDKTVLQCLVSIAGGEFTDLEIVIIDDGSTDKSLLIINEYAKTDDRIRVFSKKNGGQSSARNMGLDNARGEYIAFVDCDDTIDKDMLSSLCENIIKAKARMAVCGVRLIKNGVDISPPRDSHDRDGLRVFERIEAIEQLLAGKYILFSVCDKLYHKSLFEKLRFEEGVIHEDVLFPYQATLLCERVVCDMSPKYNYILDNESTTRGRFKKARLYDITAREKIVADIEKNMPELFPNAMNTKLVGYLNMINLLVFEPKEVQNEFLKPLMKTLSRDACGYFKNPFINKKKKLGLGLALMGAPFYKAVYSRMNRVKS